MSKLNRLTIPEKILVVGKHITLKGVLKVSPSIQWSLVQVMVIATDDFRVLASVSNI